VRSHPAFAVVSWVRLARDAPTAWKRYLYQRVK